MNWWRLSFATLCMLASLPAAATQPGEIVYDSLLSPGSGGLGAAVPGIAVGQQLQLGGTARLATKLEIRVRASAANLLPTDQVLLSLYDGLGEVFGPAPSGPLLWEGHPDSITSVLTEDGESNYVYTADLPEVRMPDAVVWTIERFVDERQFQLPFVATTTKGTPSLGVRLLGDIWGPGGGSFPARITATVPEPATMWLAIVGLCFPRIRRK